jgi:hypothetical protein
MTTSRTTRLVTRVVSAVAVAALGVSLAACSAEPDPAAGAAASESASASAEPSSSPSPTKLSRKEKAVEQAEKVLREYVRVYDEVGKKPKTFDAKEFEKVAILDGLADLQEVHRAMFIQELHQVGNTHIESVKLEKVDLTHKPKQTPPEIPSVLFTVCSDVSDAHVIDKDGNDVTNPDRKKRVVEQYWVANYKYPDGPWLVDSTELKDGETC